VILIDKLFDIAGDTSNDRYERDTTDSESEFKQLDKATERGYKNVENLINKLFSK